MKRRNFKNREIVEKLLNDYGNSKKYKILKIEGISACG
jgi:hypothetical protein